MHKQRNRLPFMALAVLAGAVALAGCPAGDADPGGEVQGTLNEEAARTLLARGYRLYWSVGAMRGGESRTMGGRAMVRIDHTKAASMKALRATLANAFTAKAIDSIIADYGIRETDGGLWMYDVPGGDVADYDDIAIVSLQADSASAVAEADVPLGDSGQVDEVTVRVVRERDVWRIASNPFGGDPDQQGDGEVAR